MVKIERLIKETLISVAITTVYLVIYLYILPYILSKILGYEEEFFASPIYIMLAFLITGFDIASRYAIKPLRIVLKSLSSLLSITMILYVTNGGVLEIETSHGERPLIISLDFGVFLYVLATVIMALSIVSAIASDKQ